MKSITKAKIKTFFISGLVYASLMAGDDYIGGNGFRLWRFILHIIVFGLFMTFILNRKKSSQED